MGDADDGGKTGGGAVSSVIFVCPTMWDQGFLIGSLHVWNCQRAFTTSLLIGLRHRRADQKISAAVHNILWEAPSMTVE